MERKKTNFGGVTYYHSQIPTGHGRFECYLHGSGVCATVTHTGTLFIFEVKETEVKRKLARLLRTYNIYYYKRFIIIKCWLKIPDTIKYLKRSTMLAFLYCCGHLPHGLTE